MKSYKFNRDKYMTRGIQEELPEVLQVYLWEKILRLVYDGVNLDYLQVFNISNHGSILRIEHTQEQVGPFNKVYIIEKNEMIGEVEDTKIFVIDDIDHATMLLASEY